MRRPTPDSDLYRWWAEALRDPNIERHEDEPQCGYYKRKVVKNGPWVPCEVYCDRVIKDGYLASDERMMVRTHDDVVFDAAIIWTYLTPITFREWKARMTSVEGLATHCPIDLTEEPARPL